MIRFEQQSELHSLIIYRGQRVGFVTRVNDHYAIQIMYRDYKVKKNDKQLIKPLIERVLRIDFKRIFSDMYQEKKGYNVIYSKK